VRELKVNTIVLQFLHLSSFAGIEPFWSAFTRFNIVGFIQVFDGVFDRGAQRIVS
jgi:hypothetical protein